MVTISGGMDITGPSGLDGADCFTRVSSEIVGWGVSFQGLHAERQIGVVHAAEAEAAAVRCPHFDRCGQDHRGLGGLPVG